jgi:hypothetical protein
MHEPSQTISIVLNLSSISINMHPPDILTNNPLINERVSEGFSSQKRTFPCNMQVPAANNTYQTITSMDEIAQQIANFNMGHFAKAEHTPFSKFRYLPTHKDTTLDAGLNKSWSEQQYIQNAHLIANVPANNRILAEKFLRQRTSARNW